MQKLIGEGPAEAAIATTLAFLIHPHLTSLPRPLGKPGLWLHGPKGTGKSIIAEILMRLCGMHNHFPLTRDATKFACQRTLESYSAIPVHIDEWRNAERRGRSKAREHQCNIEGLLSNAFTGLPIAKGTAHISKSINLVTPHTVPLITGEETSSDHALLSRYIIIDIKGRDTTYIPRGDHPDSIHSMLQRAKEHYRITRFLLRHSSHFIPMAMDRVQSYINAHAATSEHPRTLENHAIIRSALSAALQLITAPDPNTGQHHLDSLDTWLKSHCHG
jgi:hypothetical protein